MTSKRKSNTVPNQNESQNIAEPKTKLIQCRNEGKTNTMSNQNRKEYNREPKIKPVQY